MLFSIIIPTYNRADIIGIAIQSVLNQQYKLFELIIIDDGSTDDTKEVVEAFNDHRISYYKKINEERNIARNFGIKKANGKYIGFLDSDDILYKNHLAEARLIIEKNNNPEIIHLNFEIRGPKNIPSLITNKHLTNVNKFLIDENILHCNSIFVRKDIIMQYQFINSLNAIVGEDYYLWLKLASRFKIFLSLTVTNAVIEHKERSLNQINVDKLIIGTNEILSNLKNDKIFLNYYRRKANKYFAFKYVFLALHLVINRRRLESIKFLFLAIKEYPQCMFSKRFLAVIKNMI